MMLFLSFIILLITNIVWAAFNLYHFTIEGIDFLLKGHTFAENIYYSSYLKWILLLDTLWIAISLIYAFTRKYYKTDPNLHYLSYEPIPHPIIAVILPTFNEELIVEQVVKDYQNQEFVKHVIVIDNHSTDKTVEIAQRCGAIVIAKKENKGFADSCVVGIHTSLKTDANIIVFSECDGTFSGSDISKMIPYLANCDLVVGTRQVQVLNEKENQNSMLHVWGNNFLAKLLQIKYFSLLHLGIVQLTDVGCMHRCIRRKALEKIVNKFTHHITGEVIISKSSGVFAILMTMIGIEHNLKIVEVPISFKKRIGISKTKSDKKINALKYFFNYLWFILKY